MNNLHRVTIILLIGLAACQLHADPITSYLTDESGRFMFYHGVNVVYKEFPFYPQTQYFDPFTSLHRDDFVRLSEWGFRAIRLFVAWEGFQPKEGKYNYTYLQQIRKIVRQAAKYDISIVLDAHQDLYSRKFCGEGFPDWLVTPLTFPAPLKVELAKDQHGYPRKQDCLKIPFFKYYATDDVLNFSHSFFTNKNGMADKFTQMWINVVSFFKAESNVIGYDIINEPSGAHAWKNPYDMFGPAVNNNKFLLPFYKKVAKAIREIDRQKLILFEPSVADYIGGFFQTPSGSQLSKKDVLSYHTYCPFKNEHNEPSSQTKCKIIDFLYMQQRFKNVKRLKCGSMMTEFGSVPDTDAGRAEMNRVISHADRNWQSWFYWQYKYYKDFTCSTNPPWEHSFYYPNGTLQYMKVYTLSYPYAYAVCGTPISQQHNTDTYSLSFVPKKCGNSYTQIYLNEDLYFRKGFTIAFKPACPDCVLQNYRKNYYRLIVSENVMHKKLELRVAGYLS